MQFVKVTLFPFKVMRLEHVQMVSAPKRDYPNPQASDEQWQHYTDVKDLCKRLVLIEYPYLTHPKQAILAS